MKLSALAEEVATFFAKMLDHEYTTKDIFRKNFFKDWRKVRRGDTKNNCVCHFEDKSRIYRGCEVQAFKVGMLQIPSLLL